MAEKVVENTEAGEREMIEVTKSKVFLLALLRLFAFCATLSATVVMALNKQKKTFVVATIASTPIEATVKAKFQHTPAFVFFVVANGSASLHNLLMLIVELMGQHFDVKGLRLLVIPILDMMNVAILSSGASAALFMGQLGRDGNSHARWNKICDKFNTFCNHGSGSLIASSVGLVLLIIINVITISKVRNEK